MENFLEREKGEINMIKANISWNAKQIAKAVTNGSMTFDNAIQRRMVWDKVRQSMFVDSLLRNYPVPAMYTIKTDIDAPEGCKKGSKVFDCIDGKQRCEAIRAFANNELRLTGVEPITAEDGAEFELEGKTFEELPEEFQEAFNGYTMTVYFFTDITDDEISEMMSRLNNGKPLSGVEKARIKAKNLPAIISLGSHELFKESMSEAAIKAYNNEDVIIKTALQVFDEQLELSSKNVTGGYERFDFSTEQVDRITEILDTTYLVISQMKEQAVTGKKRTTVRKVLKKTNLVGVLYFVACKQDTESVDDMANYLDVFFGGESLFGENGGASIQSEYDTACTNGTNHASNVLTRNEALADGYEAYKKNVQPY
jgi:hypothetical protein